MLPAGIVGRSSARRAVSLSGYKSIVLNFDLYPDSLPEPGDGVSIAFAQFANNTTSRYLSFNLMATRASLAVTTSLDGSVGTAISSQVLEAGKWVRVALALTMSPLTGTRVRLDLTPDGASLVTAIDQVLGDAKNSDTGDVKTNVGAGIDHYNGTSTSPAYKIHFDNLSVDYP